MKKILFVFCLAIIASFNSLSAEIKVLAFSGSSREGSFNKQLLAEAVKIARQMGATVTVIDLKDYPMPFYDADLEKEQGMPKNAKLFRQQMIDHDGFIIASPEYNSSIPAILKNSFDWASRSEEGMSSKTAFQGKKFAIMSASPGKKGGIRGLIHLRNVIDDVRGVVISKQVNIAYAEQYFSEKKKSENPLLKEEIQELLQSSIKE